MFCGECGTKNASGAKFCEKCGSSLAAEPAAEPVKTKSTKASKKTVKAAAPQEPEQQSEPEKKAPKQPMKKKTKVILILAVVLAALLGGAYYYGDSITNPTAVANDYVNALTTKNFDKLYQYANISGDTTFATREQFDKVMSDLLDSADTYNYTVGNAVVSPDGMTAVVPIKAIKGSTTRDLDLTLTRDASEKRYLIFNSWKITDDSAIPLNVVENYQIYVPKGTEITFAGVAVSKDYKIKADKAHSSYYASDSKDLYELPQVFSTKTKATFSVAGMDPVEVDITPSSSSKYYNFALDEDNISETGQKKLEETVKHYTEELMQNLIGKKPLSDLKDLDSDNTTLKNKYADALDRLNEKTLKSFSLTSVSLYDLYINDKGQYVVKVNLRYSWTGRADNSDTDYSSSRYGYYTFTLEYTDDGFRLVTVDDIPSVYIY